MGTALEPRDWLGRLGHRLLFEMQFTANAYTPPTPHSPGFLERCGRCVCGCVCEGVLCYWGRKCIDCVSVCVCTVEVHMHGCVSTNKRQPHRSRCCDPAPGAGRRSRAPLTGGSTTSHSSADGPVYSATHGDTGRVSSRQRAIPR